ncbi:M48 family metalloprotease, partial [Mangrovicoccus ximenensis]|uniref:M48 family metalloprotease n=1 Tax=Mangrovicoccus ximenensis TaxID=1911570 RepID=UPI0013751A6C
MKPRYLGAILPALAIAACGTTYTLPATDDSVRAEATRLFAEAQSEPGSPRLGAAAAEARFKRVAARVAPVAEAFCRRELAARGKADCNVRLGIDRGMAQRNAYFTYAGPGNSQPSIYFSLPLLQDTRNDDEAAFVLGHEYGHRIGRHIEKSQQQAMT